MLKVKLVDSIPFIVIVSLILTTLYALDVFKPVAEKNNYKPKKLKVFVEKSHLQDIQLFAYSQGEVKPKQQVDLRSQVEGRLLFVAANLVEGGRVNKGQLLLKVDDSDYLLNVIQSEAKVAQAKQQLEKVRAQANVAKQELVNLGRDNANDLARWLPQLEHAEAELKSAKAQLDKAKLDLERTEILAPFSGVVRSENVNVGQQINRNTTLTSIYNAEIMEVNLALNGKQLSILELPIDFYQEDYNKGVDVTFSAEMGNQILSWQGRIVRTSGQFDPRTRTLNVIAEIHQNQNKSNILPGLFVNGKIKGSVVHNASTLPRTAVRSSNRIWYVDEESNLQVKTIELIHRDDQSVVVKGIANNTDIIISALVAPTPGMPVKPLQNKQQIDIQQANTGDDANRKEINTNTAVKKNKNKKNRKKQITNEGLGA